LLNERYASIKDGRAPALLFIFVARWLVIVNRHQHHRARHIAWQRWDGLAQSSILGWQGFPVQCRSILLQIAEWKWSFSRQGRHIFL
jgi:hypothetical protein